MARRTATVTRGKLSPLSSDGQPLPPIPLDTPAWQDWLADAANRSFAFQGETGTLTARREPRAGIDYWYGYRTIAGRLRKVYLGRATDLTIARLEAAAGQLAGAPAPPLPDPALPEPEARPILATRLVLPPLRAATIPRPRLEQLLDAGLAGALTLVVAPAGFGKTTMVAQWLSERMRDEGRGLNSSPASPEPSSSLIPHPSSFTSAWLTLDPSDDHPARLLRALAAALRTVVPALGADALAALTAGRPLEIVVTLLVNELAARLPPCVLVLDEYQVLNTPAAHGVISFLLDHCPPALHLLIVTRAEPPLPLARLRARGLVSELRADDLRFTPTESAAWLRSQVSPDLTDAQLAALEARTEGWAAALQLAALALRGRRDPDALIAALAGSERLVADYLAEEVLAGLAPDIYVFLLHTSILDQLCAELCAALLDGGDIRASQRMLEELERRSLFLLPLDAERRWFRYHPLFAAVLRTRLAREADAATVAALHGRACDWLAQEGLPQLAIGHALSGGYHARAAALIGALSLGALFGTIPQATVYGWLAALPEAQIRAYPRLCLLQAWELLERHDLAASAAWVRAAEEALGHSDTRDDAPRGEIVLLDIAAQLFRGAVDQSLASARQVLEQPPPDGGDLAALLHLLIGMAAFTRGDWAQAHASFVAVGLAARRAGSAFLSAAAGVSQICVELAQGDLPAAHASCRRILGQLPEGGLPGDMVPLIRLLELDVRREQGLPLDQGKVVAQAATNVQLSDIDARILAAVLMVRVALAGGDLRLAQQEADALMRLAAGERRPMVAETAAALCAQVALHVGDLAAAAGWLQTYPAPAALPQALPVIGSFMWEHCALAPAQLHLAAARAGGTAAPLHAALGHLARIAEGAGLTHSLRVRIFALRALAHAGLGETALAHAALREALAASGGAIAPFLEAGAPMRQLCAKVLESWDEPRGDEVYQHLRRLAARLEGAEPPITAPRGAALQLAEPLTPREQEVLALLAAGASNRAIAGRLILSEGTVKSYVHSLFGKLGARSRTEAVARARELGLLRGDRRQETGDGR